MKLPTKSPPENAHPVPTDEAPKGMWFEKRAVGEDRFVARWRLPGGKKESQFFASAKARAAFAVVWAKRRKEFGKVALTISPKQAEILAEFAKITGGADPLTVAREWVQYRGRPKSIALADCLEAFAKAESDRKLAADSVSHRELHARRFLEAFPDASLDQLDAGKIGAWLAGLTDPETGMPMAPRTRRHHHKTIARILSFAVASRWLDANPMDTLVLPEAEDNEEITVLSLAAAQTLFSANRDALCVGRLALEAFGGLRYTSAARITSGDLLREEKGVVFPGPKHKSGRRHYVEGWPDNLWAWINHAPAACWDIKPRHYLDLKRQAFERAGLKGEGKDAESMRNVLRHSFASYHTAAFRDGPRTAYLLTHRNASMLYAHYKGRATQADGLAYFQIVP